MNTKWIGMYIGYNYIVHALSNKKLPKGIKKRGREEIKTIKLDGKHYYLVFYFSLVKLKRFPMAKISTCLHPNYLFNPPPPFWMFKNLNICAYIVSFLYTKLRYKQRFVENFDYRYFYTKLTYKLRFVENFDYQYKMKLTMC